MTKNHYRGQEPEWAGAYCEEILINLRTGERKTYHTFFPRGNLAGCPEKE